MMGKETWKAISSSSCITQFCCGYVPKIFETSTVDLGSNFLTSKHQGIFLKFSDYTIMSMGI